MHVHVDLDLPVHIVDLIEIKEICLPDAQTKQQLKTSLAIPMYLHFLHVCR